MLVTRRCEVLIRRALVRCSSGVVEAAAEAEAQSIYPSSTAASRPYRNTVPLFNHQNRNIGSPSQPSPQTVLLANASRSLVLKALYRRLGAVVDKRDAASAIAICEEIQKQKALDPSTQAFEPSEQAIFLALLSVVAPHGSVISCKAVIADMIKCGFAETLESLNWLLKAAVVAVDAQAVDACLDRIANLESTREAPASNASSNLSDMIFRETDQTAHLDQAIFELPFERIRNWNSTTCAHLLDFACKTHNLEYALVVLSSCLRIGETLSHTSLSSLVELCLTVREFRLATELAFTIEQGGLASLTDKGARMARKLDPALWLTILRSCAQGGYLPGVELAWERAVVTGLLQPDEGSVIMAMALAAKEGSAQLATVGIKSLDETFDPENPAKVTPRTHQQGEGTQQAKGRQLALQEWHITPLFEAQCTKGDFKAAFATLNALIDRGYPVYEYTAKRISTSIWPKPDMLARALEALYELGEDKTQGVSMHVANAVLEAAVWMGDRETAMTLYSRIRHLYRKHKGGIRLTHDSIHLKPNAATIDALLSLCIDKKDIALGTWLMKDMNKSKIAPRSITYERMIVLCLTQTGYEDAFGLITEAKERGLTLTRTSYEAIVRKCFDNNDDRWKLVQSEMTSEGFAPVFTHTKP